MRRSIVCLGAALVTLACNDERVPDGTKRPSATGGVAGTAPSTATAGTASTANSGATIPVNSTSTNEGGAAGFPTALTLAGAVPFDEPLGPWNGSKVPETRAAQTAALDSLTAMTTEQLVGRSTGAINASLLSDPATSKWMDLVQSSSVALNEKELATYNKQGFVISNRQSYPNFFYGYKSIYAADLPVYITADSVLFALHRSYDKILMSLEQTYLTQRIRSLIGGLRGRVAEAPISETSRSDLALLLGVADGLINDSPNSLNAEMQSLVKKCVTAAGPESVNLFGSDREVDFSQCLPRGHYTDNPILSRYFRTLMWLGRIEMRLIEVLPDGTRVLNRRELEDVLALDEVFTDKLRNEWRAIESLISLFVGEPDDMSLPQVASLKAALGVQSSTELSTVSDAVLLSTIDAGNYGLQRISSQLMLVDPGVTTLPNSFALFGQRYFVDSHVFSKLVYPSVPERMLPNPLDVAFAALGNDQAAPLLTAEIDRYQYAPSLAKVRQLVEWHSGDYWDSNLAAIWMSALRQLSSGKYDATQLPSVAQTEAWGRRLLNTQLASWAELRHDTILYAKQSYTGTPLCEYPDGYVDPYPGLYARIVQLSTVAAERLLSLQPDATYTIEYFLTLAQSASRLQSLATEELTGAPRSQADLEFLNDAVATKSVDAICTVVTEPTGWFPKLFFDPADAFDSDPTIADVHTQPADEVGNSVGNVLHVATGYPRLMVVSVDSCDGPRAYAGVVSSYFEQVTGNFKRKTDEEWASELKAATPADVSWMQDLVVR